MQQRISQQNRCIAAQANPSPALRAPGALRIILLAILLGGPTGMISVPARGADVLNTQDLKDAHDEILTVFTTKCASCHGPNVLKPKKGFGYCLDLKKMAANPKIVVPRKPESSKLYSTIESDDMPPEDSPTGPLTKPEKDMVLGALKTWISAGAPAPDGALPLTTLSVPKRILFLIGKFHPLLAHFPIALLVAAAVAELVWLRTHQSWLTGVVRFCTLFGAAGAIVTGSLGWADAFRFPADTILTIHRWLGTAGALWAIPVLLLSERGFRRRRDNPEAGDPRPWFSLMLFVGVGLIGIAAHFGGSLVYGTDYLNW